MPKISNYTSRNVLMDESLFVTVKMKKQPFYSIIYIKYCKYCNLVMKNVGIYFKKTTLATTM